MSGEVSTDTVEANGATLYYEVRGTGPTLLFIPGAEGDAEEYLRVAEMLEDDFAILSYDRRGFSRSGRPADYAGTTVLEQTEDAAALLEALDLAPALLWGNSSGAIIALSLVLNHPELVSKAMLHEPPLSAGMSDPDAVMVGLVQATADGKVPFLKMLTGDEVYAGLSATYRSRLEADNTWMKYEFANFETYHPSDEQLAEVQKPVQVLYGADTLPFFGEVARWLAGRMGGQAKIIAGNHGAHYHVPEAIAEAIREFASAD